MTFDRHIGIDYSGRLTPITRSSALQVYSAIGATEPQLVVAPHSPSGTHRNWCRKELGLWLIEQANSDGTFIAGIDHGFSYPINCFEKFQLKTWDEFLEHFCTFWTTDEDQVTVDSIRSRSAARIGSAQDFRLTEQWTSSAKSVFFFDVQGSVAKSTHAGIPWLRRIRKEVGERVHFWPFDGWIIPAEKSVIVEVYPSLLRNRFPRADRTPDQQDAYAVARWLSKLDQNQFLTRYFDPPLTIDERKTASLEGWIFGVM